MEKKPKSRIQGGGWSGNAKQAAKKTANSSGAGILASPRATINDNLGSSPLVINDNLRSSPQVINDNLGSSPQVINDSLSSPRYRGIQDSSSCPYSHLVVNVKTSKLPDVVYIGRPGKWGNPFKIGPHGSREDVIRKYKEWITSTPEGLALLAEARVELKGKKLGCHCAPLPCHGHVLATLVNETNEPESFGTKRYNYTILQDGLVLIRKAYTLEEQQILCDEISKYGRGEIDGAGSFFSSGKTTMKDGYIDPDVEDSDPHSGYLNIGGTKARMNIPFEISSQTVWELSKTVLDFCSEICPSIPPLLHPTIWRLNYYGPKGKIGWHFDRHPFVSMELQHIIKEPVISVTLGNAGIFEYKKPNNEIVSVTLESGDVIVFGGPSRQISHQVPKIIPNTKPPSLNLGDWPIITAHPKIKRSFNEGRFNFAFYDNRDIYNN